MIQAGSGLKGLACGKRTRKASVATLEKEILTLSDPSPHDEKKQRCDHPHSQYEIQRAAAVARLLLPG
jgi:hypothetical protein